MRGWCALVVTAKLAVSDMMESDDSVARAVDEAALHSLRVTPSGQIVGPGAPGSPALDGPEHSVSFAVDAGGFALAEKSSDAEPNGDGTSATSAGIQAAEQVEQADGGAKPDQEKNPTLIAKGDVTESTEVNYDCEKATDRCFMDCALRYQPALYDVDLKFKSLTNMLDRNNAIENSIIPAIVAEGTLVYCAIQMCFENGCAMIRTLNDEILPRQCNGVPAVSEDRLMSECQKEEYRKKAFLEERLKAAKAALPQLDAISEIEFLGSQDLPTCRSVCGPKSTTFNAKAAGPASGAGAAAALLVALTA